MQNLSQKELRLIGKSRNTCGYKSMPKDKLFRGLYKPTRNSPFKLKREKIKKCLNKPTKKNLFKSKIKNVGKILYDPKINANRKIEEIKKILYDPKNNLFK